MSIKMVTKARNSCTDRNAKVLYNTETGEYRVRFYSHGKYEGINLDYITSDRDDAITTVKFEMKRELHHNAKHH